MLIFLCLIIRATENKDRNKGTIISQENSGMVGDGEDFESVELLTVDVEFGLSEGTLKGEGALVAKGIA